MAKQYTNFDRSYDMHIYKKKGYNKIMTFEKFLDTERNMNIIN